MLLAAFGKSKDIRRTAGETVARRDPREFVGFLIGRLREPIRARPNLTVAPDGTVHRTLLVKGKDYNVETYFERPIGYQAITAIPGRLYANNIPFDPYGAQAAEWVGFGIDQASVLGLSSAAGVHYSGSAPAHHGQVTPQAAPSGINANTLVRNATIAASQRDALIANTPAYKWIDSPSYQRTVAKVNAWNASALENNTCIYQAWR